MKTDIIRDDVPRALRDVWEWKESIYQDVKHLPLPQALHAIVDMAQKASAKSMAIKRAASPAAYSRVGESGDEYKTRMR